MVNVFFKLQSETTKESWITLFFNLINETMKPDKGNFEIQQGKNKIKLRPVFKQKNKTVPGFLLRPRSNIEQMNSKTIVDRSEHWKSTFLILKKMK